MHQKRALCSLALILVFSGGAFFFAPQKAHAIVSCIPAITPVPDIPVAVPVQSVGQAIRQNISNTFQASNFTKECILDALVTFLKEALIQNLTGSIVDWINNDFEGGPAFVTDPAGFFVNIADETAGHFIETQLGPIGQLLCSPFDLQLRLNLWAATSASRKQYLGCRLSEIEQNVTSAFTQGDFIASGGWRTFHAVTSDPRNNQYGAFILASDALNTEFIKKTNERLRELSEGRGFLSYKKCVETDVPTFELQGDGSSKKIPGKCLRYKVETPGSLINEQLNNAFSSELRKFELADEINEIFQALVNAGLRKVFAKGGGLRSVGVQQQVGTPRIIADSFNDVQRKAEGDARTKDAFNQGYNSSSVGDQTLGKVGAEENKKTGSGGQQTPERNLALNRPSSQSGYYSLPRYDADKAVNGGKEAVKADCYGFNCAAVTAQTTQPYWEVELEKASYIKEVWIYKASDLSYTAALGTFKISLLKKDRGVVYTKEIAGDKTTRIPLVIPDINAVGSIVRIERTDGTQELALAEVEVLGTDGETTPAGSATAPKTGATLQASEGVTAPVSAVPAHTEFKKDVAVFTINEPITNARVSMRVTREYEGKWVDAAPSPIFSRLFVRVKNKETGDIKLEEEITGDTVKEYATTKTFSANTGEQIVVGYELTPTSLRGKYGINLNLTANNIPIPGATSAVTIEVP